MKNKKYFEQLYSKFNKKNNIKNDPIQFIYKFNNFYDKEIAGFVSSCFAYGRVELIIKNLNVIFNKFNNNPYKTITNKNTDFHTMFHNHKYRYNNSTDIILFFKSLQNILNKYKSLKNLVIEILKNNPDNKFNIKFILSEFSNTIRKSILGISNTEKIDVGRTLYLIPSPDNGSACKRLNLFFKWMIRKDNIDTGLWQNDLKFLKPHLIIPLDTHILKCAYNSGMTTKKNNTWNTAQQITDYLKKIDHKDPLKYDFAICHTGINSARRN